MTEDQVQTSIVDALHALGYEVLITSRRRHNAECPKCHARFRPTGGDGASKGVPDLIVTKRTWPSYIWLGMEVKGPKTQISAEQSELESRGRICIVRSMEAAIDIARAVDLSVALRRAA